MSRDVARFLFFSFVCPLRVSIANLPAFVLVVRQWRLVHKKIAQLLHASSHFLRKFISELLLRPHTLNINRHGYCPASSAYSESPTGPSDSVACAV